MEENSGYKKMFKILDGYHVLREINQIVDRKDNECALLSQGTIRIKDQINIEYHP